MSKTNICTICIRKLKIIEEFKIYQVLRLNLNNCINRALMRASVILTKVQDIKLSRTNVDKPLTITEIH